jgi:hypothetical protein
VFVSGGFSVDVDICMMKLRDELSEEFKVDATALWLGSFRIEVADRRNSNVRFSRKV